MLLKVPTPDSTEKTSETTATPLQMPSELRSSKSKLRLSTSRLLRSLPLSLRPTVMSQAEGPGRMKNLSRMMKRSWGRRSRPSSRARKLISLSFLRFGIEWICSIDFKQVYYHNLHRIIIHLSYIIDKEFLSFVIMIIQMIPVVQHQR